MITIDGARGEGGGQVARVALSLATATRQSVRVKNIRANREQPGLKAGHLAAIRALAQLSEASVDGATLGSTDVTLQPGTTVGGEFEFAIETAGPVTLLLQALLPAMAASRQDFKLKLRGGTNVAWAPQFDDFARTHVELLKRVGVDVTPTLIRRGFFPQGGGEVDVDVTTSALRKTTILESGPVRTVGAVVASHGLPRHVMERAIITIQEGVRSAHVEQDFHRGPGTGFGIALWANCANTTLGADGVGRKGKRVEDVVEPAIATLHAEMGAGVGLDLHQADQMPVFMALAGGGAYTCRHLTPHAQTVLGLLPEFLPVMVETRAAGRNTLVEIRQ